MQLVTLHYPCLLYPPPGRYHLYDAKNVTPRLSANFLMSDTPDYFDCFLALNYYE
jgi:hypothetical protein